MSDLEAKLRVAFKEELASCVAQMEAALNQAQECPPEKLPEVFTQIFHFSHLLKGASRAVGATVIESITGRMETLFYRLQSGAVMEIDGLDTLVRGCIAYLSHTMDDTAPSPEQGKTLVQGLDKFLNQETPSEAVPDELRREIAQTFFIESEEALTLFRRLFTENEAVLSGSASVAQEDIEDAFRKAHTLKGGARLIEYHGLENQAHALEETLSQLKSGMIKLEGEALARITSLLDGLEAGLITEQEKLAGIVAAHPVAPIPVLEVSAEVQFRDEEPDSGDAPADITDAMAVAALAEMSRSTDHADRADADVVDGVTTVPITDMAPEPSVEASPERRFNEELTPPPEVTQGYDADSPALKIISEFKAPAPPPQRNAEQIRVATQPSRSEAVKIQLEHLDPLYKAVVSLQLEVQAQQMVSENLKAMATFVTDMRHDWETTRKAASSTLRKLSNDERTARIPYYFDLIGKQTRDLRLRLDASMRKQRKAAWDLNILSQKLKRDVRRIYTVPASGVFFGFRKMVNEIAAQFKKDVNLVTTGLELEADRTVIQGLKEPVMHIVRNCVFHGIEPPDVREQIGKPRQGTVSLRLYKETSSLCAEVTDDGTGIAFEKIRQKAIATGRFSEAEAAKKTEGELISLIFAPGFSTAVEVNSVAGRGVGLSAVRKSLEEIGGKLEVTSKPGKGCKFLLRIPLHVSTQPLILFQVQKRTFAIPVSGVQRLLRIPNDSIKVIGNRRVATTDQGHLIFKPMREVLGGTPEVAGVAPNQWSGLIVENDQQKVFVAVDSFVGHRDAVIKKLGRISEPWELICGGLLLEDGRVALVIDPRNLAKQIIGGNIVAGKSRLTDSAATDDEVHPKRILVVDDSITTRTLEKSILETYGYDVELAVDGEDALKRLKQEDYDIVVTDLEMPKLNGFELVQAMKADEKLKKIPVIMVTSVENPKDRERGMTNGADAYVVKGKFDQQELLQTIRHFI